MGDFWTPDFGGKVMREILRWVYLRKINPDALQTCARELLDAAEQFCLPSLMREVERELVNQVSPEVVFCIIELADRYLVIRKSFVTK